MLGFGRWSGKYLEGLSLTQFNEHHQLVVNLHHILMKLVAIALSGFLYVWPQDIASHFLIEERGERATVGQLECSLQRPALHLDDGLLLPFVAEKDEVGQ